MTVQSKGSWGKAGLLLAGILAVSFAQAAGRDEGVESLTRPLAATGKPPTRDEVRARWQFIIDEVLPLATARIGKTGSFYPFAALLDQEGQMTVLVPETPPAGLPPPREALVALVEKAKSESRAGHVAASVYLVDAWVERRDTGIRQTGVRIKLDDAWGESMEAFVPYIRNRDGKLNVLTPEFRPSRNATYQ